VGEQGYVGEPRWVEVGEVAASEREVSVDVGVAIAGELERVSLGGTFPAAGEGGAEREHHELQADEQERGLWIVAR
jgi:hypothetical protein